MCKWGGGGVPKHYTRSHVNPKYFLVVLAGDDKAVGGKKVVKSTAKDHIFVYYAMGMEILDIPKVELEISHLLATLARIEQQEHVQSMVLYASSCHSACVLEDYKFPVPSRM
nr:vacuolar-processing enzyme beta-isozyme [Tanacetum cinerariifolium]